MASVRIVFFIHIYITMTTEKKSTVKKTVKATATKTKVAKISKSTPVSKSTDLERYKRHETDTWSPEYQIWMLGKEIEMLQSHLTANPKDYPAKRALLRWVARRRQHLKYLKANSLERYEIVSKKIWLKV